MTRFLSVDQELLPPHHPPPLRCASTHTVSEERAESVLSTLNSAGMGLASVGTFVFFFGPIGVKPMEVCEICALPLSPMEGGGAYHTKTSMSLRCVCRN